MSKSTSKNKSVFQPLKDERAKQKMEKEARRNVKKGGIIKTWVIRAFYTGVMLMCMYLIILCSTLFLPSTMAVILGGLGFTLGNTTEIFLAATAGLFLIAWFFTITFFIAKKIMKVYMKGIRGTMSDNKSE